MIAVVGEALVDLVADSDGRTFRAYPGGSPANVAVGLARLDVPVTMLARLATDTFGQQLRDHLRDNGVDLTNAVSATEPSTLAVVTLDHSGAASYDFWIRGTSDWQWTPGELPLPVPSDLVAVHTGSLVAALEPGATVLEAWLRTVRETGKVAVCFDPNCRPGLMGDPEAARERIRRQVGLAHVVKASEDDLTWLHPGESYVEVARRWLDEGPALVVVTRGGEGVYAATREVDVACPTPAMPVVDSVGAGDALSAGLLTGMRERGLLGRGSPDRLAALDSTSLRALVDEAALVAALTCARAGADPPTRADLRAAEEAGFTDHTTT